MALGKIIRQQREKLGLTLDEVARRSGFSKPYISTIETGKVKNPPSDALLRRLEKLLQFESGLLILIAHLEKLPADVRAAFETSKAENAHWRSLIRRIVDEGASVDELRNSEQYLDMLSQPQANTQQVPVAGKLVPVINNVAAGYPMDYDDMDYPPGAADDYVRCPDLHDPNAFAVRVVGDSMEPKYNEGDIIIFSPGAEVHTGDDCFVRMTNPHETTFKQVFFETDEHIRLQPRNHQYPPLILPRQRINGLWPAVIRYENLQS